MLVTDGEAKKDLLGRDLFAKQIVNSLTTSFSGLNESLVVGISGSWGSGKSTLLGYVKEHLSNAYQESKSVYQVLEFNSWGNTGEQDLERNFLESILESLSELNWQTKVSDANDKLKNYLRYLKYIKFAKYAHPVIKDILDGVDDYVDQKKINTLPEIKKAADDLLINNELKLYVLIDDLDRLTPKEITILFKILKVNLNLANTIFIIAYDKEVVVNALENEYRFDGEKYLEKIIQVDFSMPVIQEKQITDIFFTRLDNYLNKISLNIDYDDLRSIWRLYGFHEYFKSIRDINRYFNNLVFSLPNIGNDINTQDFLLLEAVRTFDNRSYQNLFYQVTLMKRKSIWENISFGQSVIDDYENETTKSILSVLFTRDYDTKNTDDGKRLKDPSYFERYFSLSVPETDVTEEHIANFFTTGSNKKALLQSIYTSGKMENFLKCISSPDFSVVLDEKDLGVFGDFLKFWDSKSDTVPAILNKLISSVYLKFIKFYKDQFTAIKKAFENLEINSNDTRKISFVINYNLLRGFLQSHDNAINNAISSRKAEIEVYFNKSIIDQKGFVMYRIKIGEGTWVDNILLYSLARYLPKEYKEDLAPNLNQPHLLSFIVNNMIMIDDKGRAGDLVPDSLNIYFPDHFLAMVIREIRSMTKDKLRSVDYDNLVFFADRVSGLALVD